MKTSLRLSLVALLSLGCVGCDQATKGVARLYLPRGVTQSFFHDVLRLSYTENSGAFLSMGESLPLPVRNGILVAAVGGVLLAVLGAALLSRRLPALQVAALSLLAGGGLSNWLDRVMNAGRVTDFLNVGLGGLRTGIFNVADVAILAGTLLLMMGWSRRGEETAESARARDRR